MPDHMQRVRQAIAQVEAQRGVLGDAATDAALGPLQERLQALQAETTQSGGRERQVAVLYIDETSFSPTQPRIDSQVFTQAMASAWPQLNEAIYAGGGQVVAPDASTIIGVWDATPAADPLAEPLPEGPRRALETALYLQGELARVAGSPPVASLRVSLATGPLADQTVKLASAPVTMARRLQINADPGAVLIDHNTYRYVRGRFEVASQGRIYLDGNEQVVPVYRVLGVRARPRQAAVFSFEGVEGAMIGRDSTLIRLEAVYEQVVMERRAHVVTISGEAGIGKSRLMAAFHDTIDLLPEAIAIFEGQATRQGSAMPFGLIRDVLLRHLQIAHDDPPEVARDKLVDGVSAVIPEDGAEKAPFIGQVLGLDFSSSLVLRGILDDAAQIHQRARHYIAQFFRGVYQTTGAPVLLYLDDIHWADESSLDLLPQIAHTCQDVPLLMICLAQPMLFSRREDWQDRFPQAASITLSPLSRADSRALVDEILQRVTHVPDLLREMLVGSGTGNPFTIEELVGLLIDSEVIVKDEADWVIAPDKLLTAIVPRTVAQIVQARLTDLSPRSRRTLYAAAAFGSLFWDGVLPDPDGDLRQRLIDLHSRDLIALSSHPRFQGTISLRLKHSILYDHTVAQIDAAELRELRQQAAEWLIKASGARQAEWLAIIAEHYVAARVVPRALEYLRLAGEKAASIGAHHEAMTLYERALGISMANDQEADQARFFQLMGVVARRMQQLSKAESNLRAALERMQPYDDSRLRVTILIELAQTLITAGQREEAASLVNTALQAAERLGDERQIAESLSLLAALSTENGQFDDAIGWHEKAYDIYKKLGQSRGMIASTSRIGLNHAFQGHAEAARSRFERALKLAEEVRDDSAVSTMLLNLGEVYRSLGNLDAARQHYEHSLARCDAIGSITTKALNLINLGLIALDGGDHAEARERFLDALWMSRTSDALNVTQVLYVMVSFARLWAETNDPNSAMTLLGLVLHHPRLDHQGRMEAEALIRELEEQHGARIVQIGLQSGRALELDRIIAQILERGAH